MFTEERERETRKRRRRSRTERLTEHGHRTDKGVRPCVCKGAVVAVHVVKQRCDEPPNGCSTEQTRNKETRGDRKSITAVNRWNQNDQNNQKTVDWPRERVQRHQVEVIKVK